MSIIIETEYELTVQGVWVPEIERKLMESQARFVRAELIRKIVFRNTPPNNSIHRLKQILLPDGSKRVIESIKTVQGEDNRAGGVKITIANEKNTELNCSPDEYINKNTLEAQKEKIRIRRIYSYDDCEVHLDFDYLVHVYSPEQLSEIPEYIKGCSEPINWADVDIELINGNNLNTLIATAKILGLISTQF